MNYVTKPCIDSRWIAQTFAFSRKLTTPERLSNTWLLPGFAYGTVLLDKQNKWRMWYLNDPIYCGYYATSEDGIKWTQQELGLNLKAPDGSQLPGNAYMLCPQKDEYGRWLAFGIGPEGFCVLDNEITPHPASKSRFTALYLSQLPNEFGDSSKGLFVAFSEDGIRWYSNPGNPVISGWHDTNNMFFYDKRIGRYVLYGRPDACVSYVTHANRIIARSESEDLINWTPYRTVLDTDDRDADAMKMVDEAMMRTGKTINSDQRAKVWEQITEGSYSDSRALIRGRNRQWYGINVFPYADLYLGIGMMYDVPSGNMWLELLHSYDGIDWRRELERKPWFGLNPGDWDYPMQMTFSNPPIKVGNEIRLYYSGKAKNHHGKLAAGAENRPLSCIGARKIVCDRWVGYVSDERDAELLTQPIEIDSEFKLTLNAKIDIGSQFRVEICDVSGKPLPGFELENCEPITGNGENLTVRWNNSIDSGIKLRMIRLRIIGKKAALYAVNLRHDKLS